MSSSSGAGEKIIAFEVIADAPKPKKASEADGDSMVALFASMVLGEDIGGAST